MGISKYISNQFSNPKGLGGYISTFVMNKINKKQYDVVIDNIKSKEGYRILDIGFGNGKLLNELSLKNSGEFHGIDISEDMIIRGKKNYPKLKLVKESIENNIFEKEFFNIIYTVNTIYFWGDIKLGLRNIKASLKNEGVFINVFYTKEWLEKIKYTKYGFNKYTLEELKEITVKSGFEIVEVIEIENNKAYGIIAR